MEGSEEDIALSQHNIHDEGQASSQVSVALADEPDVLPADPPEQPEQSNSDDIEPVEETKTVHSKTNSYRTSVTSSINGKQSRIADTGADDETPLDYQLFVSKLDAGVAILLTPDHCLLEFPSLLLPRSTTTGSIITMSTRRSLDLEKQRFDRFMDLQESILKEFS